MHKGTKKLYVSLVISLVILVMKFYLISALILGATLSAFMGLLGYKKFAVMTAFSVAMVYLVMRNNIYDALTFCVLIMPMAFLIGLGFYKSKNFVCTIAPSVLLETIIIAGLIYMRMQNTSSSAVSVLFDNLFQNINTMRSYIPVEINVDELIKTAYIEIDIILPSLLIIAAGLIALIIYLISINYIRISGKKLTGFPSFSELYASRSFTGIYIIIILIIWVSGTGPILKNVYFVISSILVVCGLSICSYWLAKTGIPRILRIIIVIATIPLSMILIFPVTVLSLLGLIDSTRNFRQLRFVAGKLVR